ncbi:M15 family metallopeptidase [Nocardioides sp. 503]|uniref:M15 family metallopeptidase n=1 Tax=Nocardioides sp. 503 TaxID=2508326 RepID=UPI001FD699D1|nr:M15 family metallopeptidase [Nocardioides sp. 503]
MIRQRSLPALTATLLVASLATAGCAGADSESGTARPDRLSEGRASEGGPPLPPPEEVPATSDYTDPFDTSSPAISRLEPGLLDALQAAARDARSDGQKMFVTSGWRSREHQQRLYDEAVQKYGSEEEARRYVATPDGSAHVTGDAVDIGPTDALSWLSQHGDRYGLCQTFANEMWHYELATEPGGECPEMLPDGSARG